MYVITSRSAVLLHIPAEDGTGALCGSAAALPAPAALVASLDNPGSRKKPAKACAGCIEAATIPVVAEIPAGLLDEVLVAEEPVPANEEESAEAPEDGAVAGATPEKLRKVMKRIKAALKLAQNEGATQDEAAQAAATAARLMAQYQIEAGELSEEEHAAAPISSWVYLVDNMDNAGAQRRAMVQAVAEAMGARMVYTAQRRKGRVANYGYYCHVFATESTLEALRAVLPMLTLQSESDLAREYKAKRAELREQLAELLAERGTSLAATAEKRVNRDANLFRRSFLLGWGSGVAEKIRASRLGAAQEAMGSGAELVLATEADRAAAHIAATYKVVTRGDIQAIDGDFYQEGRAAGRAAFVAGAYEETTAGAQSERAALAG